MLKLGTVGAIIFSLALVGWSVYPTDPAINASRFDERVNLALRRTGHHLLITGGDSVSALPAVEKLNDSTFVLSVNRPFVYDSLPKLLQASLEVYHLPTNYEVALLDCQTHQIQLGYHSADYFANSTIPCVGREREDNCYQLKVSFGKLSPTSSQSASFFWLGGLVLSIISLSVGTWGFRHSHNVENSVVGSVSTPTQIKIGQSTLTLSNLTIKVSETTHTLTYREAKLLQVLAKHPNEVLTRDYILQAVWGEEGITVSRSVDVFISRLRKVLQSDPTLKIAAVHGVGYRFEVN